MPVELVFAEQHESVAEAYAMDKHLQKWSRAAHEALTTGHAQRLPELSRQMWGTAAAPRPSAE